MYLFCKRDLKMKKVFFILSKQFILTAFLTLSFFAETTVPENIFVELNKKVNPGVVSISVTRKANEKLIQLAPGFYIPRFHPQMSGAGSGFIIDKTGIIVTNSHVVSNVDKIEVQFKDNKKSYPAKLLGRDKLSDIALLKIDVKFKLTPLELGDSNELQVGQWVAAFGNPHGYSHTVTKGIISGVKREIDDLNLFPLLQTDASINRGNSGGPLVNLKGEVIGVNNAIDAGAQGISFAIPINNVKNILQDIIKYGYVRRAYIGVMLGYTPQEKGAYVTDVMPGSPARKGGVKRGDRIIQFQNTPINKPKDLVSAVAKTPVNTKANLKVLRDGKQTELTLTVRQVQENSFQSDSSKKSDKKNLPFSQGFEAVDSDPNILKSFNLPNMGTQHPIITRIDASSSAGRAGLKEGDLIFKINGSKIHKVREFKKSLRKKGPNEFHILRYHHLYDQYLVFTIRFNN